MRKFTKKETAILNEYIGAYKIEDCGHMIPFRMMTLAFIKTYGTEGAPYKDVSEAIDVARVALLSSLSGLFKFELIEKLKTESGPRIAITEKGRSILEHYFPHMEALSAKKIKDTLAKKHLFKERSPGVLQVAIVCAIATGVVESGAIIERVGLIKTNARVSTIMKPFDLIELENKEAGLREVKRYKLTDTGEKLVEFLVS